MLSPRQIRAARGLLDWDANYLAEKAKVTPRTVSNIEAGRTQAQVGSMENIARVLIAAGVEFTANDGVRMRPSGLEVFDSQDSVDRFSDFFYEKVQKDGHDICLKISDETLLGKHRTNPVSHYERMQRLYDEQRIDVIRILAAKSNFSSKFNYNVYRKFEDEGYAATAFYVFADCIGFIIFQEPGSPRIVVIQDRAVTDSYRKDFDAVWKTAQKR